MRKKAKTNLICTFIIAVALVIGSLAMGPMRVEADNELGGYNSNDNATAEYDIDDVYYSYKGQIVAAYADDYVTKIQQYGAGEFIHINKYTKDGKWGYDAENKCYVNMNDVIEVIENEIFREENSSSDIVDEKGSVKLNIDYATLEIEYMLTCVDKDGVTWGFVESYCDITDSWLSLDEIRDKLADRIVEETTVTQEETQSPDESGEADTETSEVSEGDNTEEENGTQDADASENGIADDEDDDDDSDKSGSGFWSPDNKDMAIKIVAIALAGVGVILVAVVIMLIISRKELKKLR